MFTSITTQDDFNEFMATVANQKFWDDEDFGTYFELMEPEEWAAACEFAGINYHDYTDPDKMWWDLCRAWEK